MDIRKAKLNDLDALYALGSSTPEFRVSANEPFMDKDDFQNRLTNEDDVILLAEDKKRVVGFICLSIKDSDSPVQNKYACLVYIVVLPRFRGKGVAQQLYDGAVEIVKKTGITHIYSWANAEGDGSIVNFLKKNYFAEGHKYIWMDKKL